METSPREDGFSLSNTRIPCASASSLCVPREQFMDTWKTSFCGFLLVFCLLPYDSFAIDVPDLPGSGPEPMVGTLLPTDGLGVRILSHEGQWTALFGTGGSSEPMFLISGRLENIAGKPLTYVKLQCELLGEDNVTVFRDYVYNRKAEALREEDYENGKKSLADMAVEPIKSGASETFRFIFFESDVPEFRSYRIRVLETR
jgi:hypothetical protein